MFLTCDVLVRLVPCVSTSIGLLAMSALGKSADLPTGQTVSVELLPKSPGDFGFGCPMGMFRGKLIVE